MLDINDINIKKIIVHILDSESQIPVYSNFEHPLDDDIKNFTKKHILKILSDNSIKTSYFKDESNDVKLICEELNRDENQFVKSSIDISEKLFNIMIKYPDIPPCDLIVVLFNVNNIDFLGVLKFNYKSSYIHFVSSNEEGNINKIIRQKTTLPNENQKVDECSLIDLNSLDIKILEKQYMLDGENDFYFTKKFIECVSEKSDKEKIKSLNDATYKFNKKYFENDFITSSNLNNSIRECLEENESIDINEIADKTFSKSSEMKKLYIEHLKENGIQEKEITLENKEFGEKIYSKQKIKTKDGIEIKLPREYYNDKNKLEFLNNPDGTISILIKNIGGIIDKV